MAYPDYGVRYGYPGGDPRFRYSWRPPQMSFGDQVKEFMKAVAEMSVEFGRGCRDIVRQSIWNDNSYLARNFGEDSLIWRRLKGPCKVFREKFRFVNEYLPEDRNPSYAWSVIVIVFFVALAALSLKATEYGTTQKSGKRMHIPPPSAERILLPDGRFMAYREQGVSADKARFSIIVPHPFLSSRLSGIPGLKTSLLEDFGVRLITYDLPGFGESDPHPTRNLESSALDISWLASSLGVSGKFWVVGYSSGALHAWAALRYIPDRLAGAAMFAPMVSPYDPAMVKEDKRGTWQNWTRKRQILFLLARRFPGVLTHFYRWSFLSGKHDQLDNWLSLSLGMRDKALIEDPLHQEFWQRDVEESIRQGSPKPFVEEAALQVSNWGFSLGDIKLQKKKRGKGIINLIKFLLSGQREEYTGFLGPIHIWQGMDDKVVPPAMTDFVHRILPGAAVHKLPYEGHFTYFCFCDECHRQIFTTLFGSPLGPLNNKAETDQNLSEAKIKVPEEIDTLSGPTSI